MKNLTFDMACWMLSIKMSVILSSSFLWKNVNLLLPSRRVVWTLIVLLFISSVDGKKKTTSRRSRPETVRPTISPTDVKEIKILDVWNLQLNVPHL